jgi:hypothetical protein
MRHWRWTGIVVSSMLTAGLIMLSMALAAWHQAEGPIHSGYIGFLVAIPLIAVPVWQLSRIELRTAPAWMIRTALATATDDERAYLFERLLQFATSEWRQDPIACGVLVDFFREARLRIVPGGKGKRDRLIAERGKQMELMRSFFAEPP